jgi:hypothetical protein
VTKTVHYGTFVRHCRHVIRHRWKIGSYASLFSRSVKSSTKMRTFREWSTPIRGQKINERAIGTTCTKNRGWIQVLWKGKQFLFQMWLRRFITVHLYDIADMLYLFVFSTFKTVVILYICNFLNTSFAVMIYCPIIIFYKDYNFLCDLHLNHVHVSSSCFKCD